MVPVAEQVPQLLRDKQFELVILKYLLLTMKSLFFYPGCDCGKYL